MDGLQAVGVCAGAGGARGDVITWFWIGSHAEYDKLISEAAACTQATTVFEVARQRCTISDAAMPRPHEQAIQAVQSVPPPEQDTIAAVILEELEDDRRWDKAFGRSQEQLARLAQKAGEDVRAGRVRDVSAEEL